MRQSMIEDVPLSIYLFDPAMGRAGVVQPILVPASLIAYVAVRDDGAAIAKVPVGIVGSRIAQLMVFDA